jgi:hypothetical protein
MTDAKKIKRFALPAIPYVFLWWLFDKAGQAVRLSGGRDALQKIVGGVANLDKAFDKPLPSFDPFDILVGLVGAGIVFGVVAYRKHNVTPEFLRVLHLAINHKAQKGGPGHAHKPVEGVKPRREVSEGRAYGAHRARQPYAEVRPLRKPVRRAEFQAEPQREQVGDIGD